MNRLFVIFCLPLLVSCSDKNPFKEAIKRHTQTEEEIRIVLVDTIFRTELLESLKKIDLDLVEYYQAEIDRLSRIRGSSFDKEGIDSLMDNYKRSIATYDSLIAKSGGMVSEYKVIASLGDRSMVFSIDSAKTKVLRMNDEPK